MKKIFLMLICVASIAFIMACDGGNNSKQTAEGKAEAKAETKITKSSGSSSWTEPFGKLTGLSGLKDYPGSEVSYTAGSSKVIFTAKSEISKDSDEYKNFLRTAWDAAKAASPDGIYRLDYNGMKKGEQLADFDDWVKSGAILYYTNSGHIVQLSFPVKGNTLTLRYDNVYNQSGERAKP